MDAKRKVCYFYDGEVGNFYYGQGHPMKPHRIRMTDNLLKSYGIQQQLDRFTPSLSSVEDMVRFHSDEYIDFLGYVTPDNQHENLRQLRRFNVGDDCPAFDGLFRYCQMYTGASVGGVQQLNSGAHQIAINWSGGLHHAKKSEASGFCYVNDIVLAILELLKVHQRVLYIDLDIHHGDGVEEAFYTTDRVMTVSFHKYGDYFPGTGDLDDTGVGPGKGYSLNVPLRDGADDKTFETLFVPIMDKVMERYQPGAIVYQSGADSLSGDRLGCFNLSIRGHGACLQHMLKYNVPTLLLGGGGYTIRNVARCWAYETGTTLNEDLNDHVPSSSSYYEYFGPDYRLHYNPSNMENRNNDKHLQGILKGALDALSKMKPSPSAVAPSGYESGAAAGAPSAPTPEEVRKARDEEADPDTRLPARGPAHPAEPMPAEGETEDKPSRHRDNGTAAAGEALEAGGAAGGDAVPATEVPAGADEPAAGAPGIMASDKGEGNEQTPTDEAAAPDDKAPPAPSDAAVGEAPSAEMEVEHAGEAS